jgi:hypothetical protein
MGANKKIYILALLSCLAGYVWLGYNFFDEEVNHNFTVCIFKNVTGVPCPSCGITRSLVQLVHGNILEAIYVNPLGLLAALFLLIAPCWLLADIFNKKESFMNAFRHGEMLLKKHVVYVPLILLGLLNWYWNIIKDL